MENKIAGQVPGIRIHPCISVTFNFKFMKKKISLTLLLALFVIAGSWAQKNHNTRFCNNRYENYRSADCHSKGRGHDHHPGKHKKGKKHKAKHHGQDDCKGYSHRERGYNDNGRQHDRKDEYRDRDRNDNRSNSGYKTGSPSNRAGRNAKPMSKSTRRSG